MDIEEPVPMNLRLGRWSDTGAPVSLPPKVHRHPIYALGLSGTGKSTLLGQLALQWSAMGEGVLVIDVKDGQLARDIVARSDPDNTILVAPGLCYFDNHPHHWGLNLLELPNRYRQTVSEAVNNVLSMLERLDRADYTQMTLLRTQLDCAVRLVLYEPEPNLRRVREALTNEGYRKVLMAQHGHHLNPEVLDHFARFDDPKSNSNYGRAKDIVSTVNRLKEILTPEELAWMLIQQRSTMRFGEWLEAGKLVVVDCASGMSNRNAELLGNLVLTQMMHFTFMRTVSESDPWAGITRPIRLICDEFDLLAGNNFSRLISKARSYRVFPVMSHQNLDQLKVGRGAAQTLYNDASGVPVMLAFALTDQDRATIRRLRQIDEAEATSAYTATLSLKSVSMPLGLLDAGQSALIELFNWQTVGDPAKVDRAIEAQRPYVTAERQLRETVQADDPTAHQRRTAKPKAKKPPVETPDESPGGRDLPPGAESVSEAQRGSAGKATVPPPEAY
jgi:hypothetical protein